MNKLARKITTILCDDIRREIGNKDSLMGIYQDIVIDSIPAILPRLSLMAYLNGLTEPINDCIIKLSIPGGEPRVWPHLIPGNKKSDKNARLAISVGPVEIKTPGHCAWEIYFNGSKKPQVIHKFEIRSINYIQTSDQKL